ncbi:hypothetical protein Bca101_052652 [Brassica carinata]
MYGFFDSSAYVTIFNPSFQSTSSLSGSTSNAPDGSRRTLTSSFPGQFGSMSPVFNPDGSLKGIYDLEGNFYLPNSEPTRGGSRNSGLLATPALVTASSSRAPPPASSMRNRARGSSTSRALISSDGGIPQSQAPRQNFPVNNRSSGSTEQNRMMSGVLGSPHVFPVLGSSYPAPRGRSQNQVQARNRRSSMTGGPSRSVSAGYNQPLQHQPNASQHRGHRLPLPPIGQPFGDVAGSSSNPTQAATATATETSSSPAPDPFSMLGLVGVLNGSNPDATTLAIGMDLTDMGLDMTSKEDIFKTFASPWANEPLKDDPNEFTLPQCYNEIQRPTPHRGMFRRFALKTLFYIFYSMPQDEAQLYAADEL